MESEPPWPQALPLSSNRDTVRQTHETYRHLDNDQFELSDSSVAALFQGFSRTLAAPAPDEGNQGEH